MERFISQHQVKTRKPHNCWGCTNVITKGTNCIKETDAENNKIYSVYWCDDCISFLETMDGCYTDYWEYGELKDYCGYKEYVAKIHEPIEDIKQ